MKTFSRATAARLATLALLAAAPMPLLAAVPATPPIAASSQAGATIQHAYIDGPAQGHRRTKKSKDSSSTIQPRAAEPKGETPDARKAYLHQYGF